jgi:hypothetical protein
MSRSTNRNFGGRADSAFKVVVGHGENAGQEAVSAGTHMRASSSLARPPQMKRSKDATRQLHSALLQRVRYNETLCSNHITSSCTAMTPTVRRSRRGPSSIGVLFDSSASAPLAPNIGLELFVPALPLRFEFGLRLI